MMYHLKVGVTNGEVTSTILSEHPLQNTLDGYDYSFLFEGTSSTIPNLIVSNGLLLTPEGFRKVSEIYQEGMGWRVNCSVPKINAELAMEEAGVYDKVMLALSTSTNKKLKIAYNATTEIPRTSPYVDLMAGKLRMTDEEIDSLFYLAESIDLST